MIILFILVMHIISCRRAGIQTADVDTRNQAHSASNILLSEGSDPELSDTPLTVDLQGAPSQVKLSLQDLNSPLNL